MLVKEAIFSPIVILQTFDGRHPEELSEPTKERFLKEFGESESKGAAWILERKRG